MQDADEKPIAVGIGIIRRGREFLVRRRPPGTVYAGYWEFPGGKCKPGESPAEATCRECLEETGLAVATEHPRGVRRHRYPHGLIELSFYDCRTIDPSDEPAPETGFRWIDVAELKTLRFPEANDEILAALIAEFA
jgi:8-oxo-dGTP diphosphatase